MTCWLRILLCLLHIGCQAVHPLYNPAPFRRDHFHEQALGALRGDTASVAFTDFRAYELPRTGQAKAFCGSFVGFYLVFFGAFFARHRYTPIVENPRISFASAEMVCFGI